MSTFSELVESIPEMREKILDIMGTDRISVHKLSKRIGISHVTLRSFMKCNVDSHERTLLIIQEFIKNYHR
jgi:hypothetical protein